MCLGNSILLQDTMRQESNKAIMKLFQQSWLHFNNIRYFKSTFILYYHLVAWSRINDVGGLWCEYMSPVWQTPASKFWDLSDVKHHWIIIISLNWLFKENDPRIMVSDIDAILARREMSGRKEKNNEGHVFFSFGYYWPALCAGLLCCNFFDILTPVPYHHFFSSLILLFIYI